VPCTLGIELDVCKGKRWRKELKDERESVGYFSLMCLLAEHIILVGKRQYIIICCTYMKDGWVWSLLKSRWRYVMRVDATV
jgi:hypothetical protein